MLWVIIVYMNLYHGIFYKMGFSVKLCKKPQAFAKNANKKNKTQVYLMTIRSLDVNISWMKFGLSLLLE